jgi:perosamine synthetase
MASEHEAIPLCAPHLSGNEWTYVKQCLDAGWLSSAGSFVERFETEFARKLGVAAATACASGTAALHVALRMLGVGLDDEVVMSSLTYVAPANAVTYVGAHPAFVDAETEFAQIDTTKLAEFLERGCRRDPNGLRNSATGRRVAALMPIHILGHPCDLDAIVALAERFELPVIEDASQSLGAMHGGRHVGTIGRLGCFSFNHNKIITAGNGGMITAHDPAVAKRARYLTTQAREHPVEFVHGAVAYNYRPSNIQAAVGLAQFERLDAHVARKREIAARYDRAFRDVPGILIPREAPWARSTYWMYTVRIGPAFGRSSREVQVALRDAGISARPIWQPMHRSKAHAGAFSFKCEAADKLFDECLSLPCSVGLTEADQQRVIDTLTSLRV